jgi:HK97 family phage major capsid protein
MKHLAYPRVRGPVFARAQATPATIHAAIEQLNTAFAAYRAENDQRLAAVERGRGDVLDDERVARINNEITQLTATANEMREQLDAVRAMGGAGGQGGTTPEQRAYNAAFATFFRSGRGEESLTELAVRAQLTTQSNPDGGYVVTEEMDTAIVRVLANVSAMRQLARVISTSTGRYKTLVSQGGATSGWVSEEQARPATNTPALSEISVFTGEMYANPAATQTLLDDARVDIAQWLADEVSITFAEQEGAAFISGNGINKPKGVLAYPTVANTSYAWGKLGFVVTGAAAAFASSNPADAIINLHYALKAGYRNNASWLISDAVMGTVRQMKDGQDNYLWAPPTVDGPATILGKPVVTDDNMPALAANAFPIAFGDFQRGYLISDRMGVQVLRDPYTNKPYVQFYTTKRVGGGVVNFEAIKLLKCST